MKRMLVQGRPYWRIERKNVKADLGQLLPSGRASYVNLHWTAGSYSSSYRDYQILIAPDYVLVSETLLNWNMHQHTWRRNTGAIGISFQAMANATERNPGYFPITLAMIEVASLIIGMLRKKYSISSSNIVDHRYWAEIDGYKNYRWDVRWLVPQSYNPEHGETVLDMIQRKSKWYFSKL